MNMRSLLFVNYERRLLPRKGVYGLHRCYLMMSPRVLIWNFPQLVQADSHHWWYSTSSVVSSQQTEEPFYGKPRYGNSETSPSSSSSSTSHSNYHSHRHHHNRSIVDRITIALHNATTAFADPTRADAVAALGDITGPVTLRRIHQRMMENETGRLILQDRPVVSKATIPYRELIASAPDGPYHTIVNNNDITFGQAYGSFLKSHGFDPDERDEVKYIEDETLAYVMLRYRQCHDFWHALTGLPPTVLGELGIKWLELFQTGLPVAALSSTVGSLRLDAKERQILVEVYLPWAIETSQNLDNTFLMNVYYEKEFDTPLMELRRRLNLTEAPRL